MAGMDFIRDGAKKNASTSAGSTGTTMEYRQLGGSGLKVPVLSFGTGTFGGGNEFFKAWGASDVAEATRLVDICLDAGLNMFDTADIYSNGLAEEITRPSHQGPPRQGAHLHQGHVPNRRRTSTTSARRAITCSKPSKPACAASAPITSTSTTCTASTRLTPVEETLRTLDDLVRAGKVRYIGCSNFSGWHLMKSLAVSERYGWRGTWRTGVLLARRPRVRVGADAARHRSESRHDRLEPAGLGPADRQNPPRQAASRKRAASTRRRISARRSRTNTCTRSSMR